MKKKFDENNNPIFSQTENILINILCFGGVVVGGVIGMYLAIAVVSRIFNNVFEYIQSTDIYIFATTKPSFFIAMIFIGLFFFTWFFQVLMEENNFKKDAQEKNTK